MNWRESKNIEVNTYDLPGDWLKIEYFEAINILFRIENSLRIFVYIILKNEFKDKWKDLSITSDDEESSTIGAIARKRVTQDKNYAYLGYVLNSPFLHLTSGELIRIITSDSYWKHFKDYFLSTKDIIKNKLDEIGNVRNAVAHFRPIKKGDIDLIKQNSIHTLTEIEKAIKDLIVCPDIVPSNTEENWYKELITVGTEDCHIGFRQSKKETWVKIVLDYTSPSIIGEKTWYGHNLKVFNLKTNKLLTHFKDLAKHTICFTENVPGLYVKSVDSIKISKQVFFTLSRKSLNENYQAIKKDLESLLLQITTELELIKSDNLARGKIVEVINTRIEKAGNDEYLTVKTNQFVTKPEEDSQIEFWGTLNFATDDFISDTEQYPWMPVTISEDKDLPF